MRPVREQEIGLMFWATGNPERDLARVSGFGLAAGQLGFPGELPLQNCVDDWALALAKNPEFAISTAVCSYVGEDYSDIQAVRQSVGFVPQNTQAERVARTKEVADIAASLAIQSVACHIGFIPENRRSQEYKQLCAIVRDICDHLGAQQQEFTLETGQEYAEALLAFIDEVGKENLKINFDPANIVLYGMGDPVSALTAMSSHVISVHCKDAVGPRQADSLGVERQLGSGEVNYPAFLESLRQIGYKGILSIEREEPDARRRDEDIRHAVGFLNDLLNR